ncbi:MAG: N-formylglutamate amidohydrolase, partial [Pseudomonadota bacterium]
MVQAERMIEERAPVEILNPDGAHPILFVCEHASHYIPASFGNLGLSGAPLTSHIAWDPGAFETAKRLSSAFDAPLFHGTVSRLVYDCNRPPEAPDAMPEESGAIDIPKNRNLTAIERQERIDAFYRPFEKMLSDLLDRKGREAILVTIHSFTRKFLGQTRSVEVGILHDDDARLADALLNIAEGYDIRRNEPYGPEDGVTHTLKRHALPRNLLNVMI